jgi:hypothetical protein
MNRREVVTGTAALAVGALLPGTNLSSQQEMSLQSPEANRVTLTTVATVDDPDVDQITIKVRLKEGHHVSGSDSYIVERALLKHVGTNLIPWFQHCRDTGMKTL